MPTVNAAPVPSVEAPADTPTARITPVFCAVRLRAPSGSYVTLAGVLPIMAVWSVPRICAAVVAESWL